MGSNLKGWQRLSNLRPGAVFTTRDGVRAVKSEYKYNNHNPQPLCILLESGEYAHFSDLDLEWVKELEAFDLVPAGEAVVEVVEGEADAEV